MSDTAQRDRSPAFPFISLKDALQRLEQFEAHFKRSSARPEKVGEAWGINTKAYADRIAAAIRYYGLLDYQMQGDGGRSIVISEQGRIYLRVQQEQVKNEVIAAAALRPKQLAKFWNEWSADRPADSACIDELVLKNGFSEKGARDFLKVYDANIGFAGLKKFDKSLPYEKGQPDKKEGEEEQPDKKEELDISPPILPAPATGQRNSSSGGATLVKEAGERELVTGLLSKGASFRLIVSGKIGSKEIERLIRKLEFDKEILADDDDDLKEEITKGGN